VCAFLKAKGKGRFALVVVPVFFLCLPAPLLPQLAGPPEKEKQRPSMTLREQLVPKKNNHKTPPPLHAKEEQIAKETAEERRDGDEAVASRARRRRRRPPLLARGSSR
jgi:hypothetical protein